MAKKKPKVKADPELTVDQRAVLALVHCGRPRSYLTRLSAAERQALAKIWDDHAAKGSFNRAIDRFWAQQRLTPTPEADA